MKPDLLSQISAALAPVADSGRAPAMRAYMRDQFAFLGVGTPQRRSACKDVLRPLKGAGADALLGHARALWELPEREYQYVALDLMTMHWKELNSGDIPALLELVQDKSWWDTVDALAGIIGKVLCHGHEYMDAALRENNMWVRRIALLHQLGWRNKTDEQRLFEYALTLAHEKEFFIQKAIGWALRDYARHAPDAVRLFTRKEKERLAPLSFREANKHLAVSFPI
ncbi:DNA alkylation repair protein [Duganella sp. BuS-21]|uniref:DNA alkylation repair protein n=1 Tax=Duganella sp. BuS-21 TaxID=2943848 RepID=UPI0035A73938